MPVLTTTSRWFKRSLMAAVIVATGALTLGATTNPASAQAVYTYPYSAYYPYYPYYPTYSYYQPYYPYYGYPGPVVRVGWGWGWRGGHWGWGGGHGGHHR